jgi:hypothetical protein
VPSTASSIQVCTATNGTSLNAAASHANGMAASLARAPSMPATTGPPVDGSMSGRELFAAQ